MTGRQVAALFAEWAIAERAKSLPDDVQRIAQLCVLDACALGVGGTVTVPGRAALASMATYSLPEGHGGTLLGDRRRLSPTDAAMLNGLLAHTLQSDDGIRRAHGHPGTSVVPAALGAGEIAAVDGARLLLAVVSGYELFAALGEAVSPTHLARGFHPSGTVGAVSSALAAAQALNLDRDQVVGAIGIAGSSAGGLMEYAPTGTMATYSITGNAARLGLQSALLAANGFTGPASIVEGRKGFVSAMADEEDISALYEPVRGYRIRETYFKPYPSCRHTHAAIDASLALSDGGISADSIASVEVRAYRLAVDECDNPAYDSLAGADSSLQFAVASALRWGAFGFRQRSEEAVHDEVTRALAKRIRVVHDLELDERLPRERPTRVTVKSTDGTSKTREVALARGEPETALSVDELGSRARDAMTPALSPAKIEQFLEAIESMPSARSLDALLRAVVPQ